MTGLYVMLAVPQTRPAIEVFGFHLVEATAQRRSMEIDAQKARVFKPDNIMALDIVRALVWGQGPKPFEVRGDTAITNSDTQDLEMTKNARVLSPDGFLFKTTALLYKASDRTISSEEAVEANQVSHKQESDLRLLGRGLLIDLGRNTYEIKHSVRSEQRTTAEKSLSINSNELIIFPEDQKATFSRHVLVKATDFSLKGERLLVNFNKKDDNSPLTVSRLKMDSPKPGSTNPKAGEKIQAELKSMKIRSYGLTIDLDPEQGGLKKSEAIGEAEAETDDKVRMHADTLISDSENGRNRVLMKGSVTILTGTRKGTCQEAVFYPDSGDIILERIATITNEKQILEGDRIRFSTKHSNIFVEKARGEMERKDLGR